MELKNVLSQLKSASGADRVKTASAEPKATTPKTAAAQAELFHALNQALGVHEKPATQQGEKTASDDNDAVSELEKMAASLANADQEVMKKEAELFGACVMDGFVQRGAQYGISLVDNEKNATAEEIPTEEEFVKWAQENPLEYKALVQQGYNDGVEQVKQAQAAEFEKWAATKEGQEAIASYNQGYEAAAAELKKLASTEEGREKIASFNQGYEDTVKQINEIAQSNGGQEKLAALKQGYEEGVAQMQKLAYDYYNRGYNDTKALLKNMGK